jgi:hypothetical protein
VAGLPALINETSPEKISVLVNHAANGRSPEDLARKLFPGSGRAPRRRRRNFVEECYGLAAHDPRFQEAIATRARGQLIWHLNDVVQALVRRASTGGARVDAMKLALEASGFHNPRVQHEHSGEITVKLDIPRPPVLDDEGRPEQVVDADVVED